ncbi:hypothetical protein ACN9KO_000537 [Yersinia enterocolitica]
MSENTDYETLKAEYIELDKKYRAVAAENMLLKVAARDMLGGWKEIRRSGGESEIYGIGWDRSQSAVESALNTPTTTQALNEIKAQGVDELSEWSLKANDGFGIDVTPEEIALFAASLRGNN